jgi:two-component system phosphate regulon response regulator PhoB
VKRILVVEDSRDFQLMVSKALSPGFEVVFASDTREAEDLLRRQSADLILLDVTLPDQNGFEFCAKLKKDESLQDIPVFFLTGKSGVTDKVLGFSLGAEDYVVKPFDVLELRARVESKIRRSEVKNSTSSRLQKGKLVLDFTLHRALVEQDGKTKELSLTPIEFRLLTYLARNEDRVVNRDQILESVWGNGKEVFDRAIDKHVWSLRHKLGSSAPYIETVPTVGYRFSVKT